MRKALTFAQTTNYNEYSLGDHIIARDSTNCSQRRISGHIGVSKSCSRVCLDICYNRIDTQSAVRANVLSEVMMI